MLLFRRTRRPVAPTRSASSLRTNDSEQLGALVRTARRNLKAFHKMVEQQGHQRAIIKYGKYEGLSVLVAVASVPIEDDDTVTADVYREFTNVRGPTAIDEIVSMFQQTTLVHALLLQVMVPLLLAGVPEGLLGGASGGVSFFGGFNSEDDAEDLHLSDAAAFFAATPGGAQSLRRGFYFTELLLLAWGVANTVSGLFECMTLTISLTAQRSAVSKVQLLMRQVLHLSGISFGWVTSTLSLALALPFIAARGSAAGFVVALVPPFMYLLTYPVVAFSGCFGWARASSDVLLADVSRIVENDDAHRAGARLGPLAHCGQ